jgi:Cu/Ag efflux protein CusF
MTTTTLLMLVCVIMSAIAIYANDRRKKEAEAREVAESDYARIASQKVDLESKQITLCKEIARLESLSRTVADDLIKAHQQINTMGVKRASDGTFRSSDADVIAPRKPRVVKRNQAVAEEV